MAYTLQKTFSYFGGWKLLYPLKLNDPKDPIDDKSALVQIEILLKFVSL